MMSAMGWAVLNSSLNKRDASDADSGDETEVAQREIFTSWSLFILIVLLIVALFTSYFLQARKIQAVHETVISIFSGMIVGLILRLTAADSVLGLVSFDYQFFFNLLLPPIILASGYELHQGNFFRNIGTILTFAFVGTFISAIVLGMILWVWSHGPLESMKLTFVDAISVGATLSATDPVTILAIFNTYKVDPHLYTVIFGESILNDAVAIVLFETAQRYKPQPYKDDEGETHQGSLTPLKLLESFGVFLLVFFGSLVIGLAVGIGTSLFLKLTHIRRSPKIESCIILLIAYASYFFANAVHLSGIVSLLFCGICLKHYAYHNMSRRTQLTTKFIFQVLAQLSENFIFIYLGLSLFTEQGLEYKPLFIIVAVIGICIARGLAIFPLSKIINAVIRWRKNRFGAEHAEELTFADQAMLFWAGLRGAVGVALAAGLTGQNSLQLRATILVVVVLTVIIFGGTTSRMLEILGIRTGVVEEIDSDDEFDIEPVPHSAHYRGKSGASFGHYPKDSANGAPLALSHLDVSKNGHKYSSGNIHGTPPESTDGTAATLSRKNSARHHNTGSDSALTQQQQQGLLDPDEFEESDLDLPPTVKRPMHSSGQSRHYGETQRTSSAPPVGHSRASSEQFTNFREFMHGSTDDPAKWFRQIDEGFIKPKLLLDPGDGSSSNHPPRGPGNV